MPRFFLLTYSRSKILRLPFLTSLAGFRIYYVAVWVPKRELYTANLKVTLLKPELIPTSPEKVKIRILYMHKHPLSWKK